MRGKDLLTWDDLDRAEANYMNIVEKEISQALLDVFSPKDRKLTNIRSLRLGYSSKPIQKRLIRKIEVEEMCIEHGGGRGKWFYMRGRAVVRLDDEHVLVTISAILN